MEQFLRTLRSEPAGALLVAANVAGVVVALWLVLTAA